MVVMLLLAGLFGAGLAVVGAGLVYALLSIAELRRAVRSMRVEEQSLLAENPTKQSMLAGSPTKQSSSCSAATTTTEDRDVEQQAIKTPHVDSGTTSEEEEDETVLPLISGLLYIEEEEEEDKVRRLPKKMTLAVEEKTWPSDGPVTPLASSSQVFFLY